MAQTPVADSGDKDDVDLVRESTAAPDEEDADEVLFDYQAAESPVAEDGLSAVQPDYPDYSEHGLVTSRKSPAATMMTMTQSSKKIMKKMKMK